MLDSFYHMPMKKLKNHALAHKRYEFGTYKRCCFGLNYHNSIKLCYSYVIYDIVDEVSEILGRVGRHVF